MKLSGTELSRPAGIQSTFQAVERADLAKSGGVPIWEVERPRVPRAEAASPSPASPLPSRPRLQPNNLNHIVRLIPTCLRHFGNGVRGGIMTDTRSNSTAERGGPR